MGRAHPKGKVHQADEAGVQTDHCADLCRNLAPEHPEIYYRALHGRVGRKSFLGDSGGVTPRGDPQRVHDGACPAHLEPLGTPGEDHRVVFFEFNKKQLNDKIYERMKAWKFDSVLWTSQGGHGNEQVCRS